MSHTSEEGKKDQKEDASFQTTLGQKFHFFHKLSMSWLFLEDVHLPADPYVERNRLRIIVVGVYVGVYTQGLFHRFDGEEFDTPTEVGIFNSRNDVTVEDQCRGRVRVLNVVLVESSFDEDAGLFGNVVRHPADDRVVSKEVVLLRGGAEHIVQFPAEVATLELVTQGQVVDKIRILVLDGVVGVNSLELSEVSVPD